MSWSNPIVIGETDLGEDMHAREYSRYAKGGFLLGALLFGLGATGELVLSLGWGHAPTVVSTILFDMEIIGIALGLFAPLLFGFALPLIE